MKNDMINTLFNPKSIAIIGASTNPGKIGYRLADNIFSKSYSGEVYLVNPKGENILGKKSITSIEMLPEGVDLAILAIPNKFFIQSVKDCMAKKIKTIVALTAGFKETGDEGIKKELELKEVLAGSETILVGPNCAGFSNPLIDLHAAIEIWPKKGKIAFISQSGSMCSVFSSNIASRSAGISKFISLGNKVQVNESNFIDYLRDDKDTSCISLYLEDIANGVELRKVVEATAISKPIVVFKSGRTPEGASATFSHTGAMAGDDKLVDGAFKQMGICRADTLEELYDLSAAFTKISSIKNRRIAIISDAGGPGVITADALVQQGLEIPRLSKNTQEKMYTFLPSFSSVQNPIDMTFTRDLTLYERCIGALKDENIGTAVITIPSQFDVKEKMVTMLIEAKEKHNIPLVVVWFSADEVEKERRTLWEKGIPCFRDPNRAAAVLFKIYKYSEWLFRRKK